jgi:hypothetical protein
MKANESSATEVPKLVPAGVTEIGTPRGVTPPQRGTCYDFLLIPGLPPAHWAER